MDSRPNSIRDWRKFCVRAALLALLPVMVLFTALAMDMKPPPEKPAAPWIDSPYQLPWTSHESEHLWCWQKNTGAMRKLTYVEF